MRSRLSRTNGDVVPVTAPWDGQGPLKNGTGISRAGRVGSLGVAVQIERGHCFACAQHVLGDARLGGPLFVWTVSGGGASWQPSRDIAIVPPPAGQTDSRARMDLGFVSANVPATNEIPGGVAHPELVGAFRDSALRYRGARNGVTECTYEGAYTAEFQGSFGALDLVGIDTTVMGVVSFSRRPYDPTAYEGDSGAALWVEVRAGVMGCVGQLVGVSRQDPVGLIVRLADAFQRAGVVDYSVVEGAS